MWAAVWWQQQRNNSTSISIFTDTANNEPSNTSVAVKHCCLLTNKAFVWKATWLCVCSRARTPIQMRKYCWFLCWFFCVRFGDYEKVKSLYAYMYRNIKLTSIKFTVVGTNQNPTRIDRETKAKCRTTVSELRQKPPNWLQKKHKKIQQLCEAIGVMIA